MRVDLTELLFIAWLSIFGHTREVLSLGCACRMASHEPYAMREISLDSLRNFVDATVSRAGPHGAVNAVLLHYEGFRNLLPPNVAPESTSILQENSALVGIQKFIEGIVKDSASRRSSGRPRRNSNRKEACWILTPQEAEEFLAHLEPSMPDDTGLKRSREDCITDPKSIGSMILQASEISQEKNSRSVAVALKCSSIFIDLFASKIETLAFFDDIYPEVRTLANSCRNFLELLNKLPDYSKKRMKRSSNESLGMSDSTVGSALSAGEISGALARSLSSLAEQALDPASINFTNTLATAATQSQAIDVSLFSSHSPLGKGGDPAKKTPSDGKRKAEEASARRALTLRNQAIQNQSLQNAFLQATMDTGIGGNDNDSFGLMPARNKGVEPPLTLAMHIRFLEHIEKKLVLNDRKSRDWSALEKMLALDCDCPVKHVKQKAKRVLQERRSRLQLRFWEKIKAAGDVDKICLILSEMIGKHAWADHEFLIAVAEHLCGLVRNGKRSPGNILEWPECTRMVITNKLLFLHQKAFPKLSFNKIHDFFKELFSVADIEICILSMCNCIYCLEDWNLAGVDRESEAHLRLHWSKEKAQMLRVILEHHRDCPDSHFHSECRKRLPKLRNWRNSDIDIALRAAHPVEECERCVRSRLDLAAKSTGSNLEEDTLHVGPPSPPMLRV